MNEGVTSGTRTYHKSKAARDMPQSKIYQSGERLAALRKSNKLSESERGIVELKNGLSRELAVKDWTKDVCLFLYDANSYEDV